MAIAAINSQSRDVMLMAEGNGLIRSNVLPGDIRRALKLHQCRADRRKKKNNSKNAGAGQGVCTSVEDLCHRLSCVGGSRPSHDDDRKSPAQRRASRRRKRMIINKSTDSVIFALLTERFPFHDEAAAVRQNSQKRVEIRRAGRLIGKVAIQGAQFSPAMTYLGVLAG